MDVLKGIVKQEICLEVLKAPIRKNEEEFPGEESENQESLYDTEFSAMDSESSDEGDQNKEDVQKDNTFKVPGK